MYNIEVYCSLDFEALHKFPNAGEFCDQAHLENLHRHIFRIKCAWEASHANREREFIDVKHAILNYLKSTFPLENGIPDMQATSCEALAMRLLDSFAFLKSVEVSEDGENGAIVSK